MIKQTLLKYILWRHLFCKRTGWHFFFNEGIDCFESGKKLRTVLQILSEICTHSSNLLKAYSVSDLVLPLQINLGENLMNTVKVFGPKISEMKIDFFSSVNLQRKD